MKNLFLRFCLVTLWGFLCVGGSWAQQLNPRYQDYVRSYAPEAVRQMSRYRIPASIKLAQGLIETGAGASYLAREANNHFGIKCHKTWQGQRTYRTDDAENECFRRYNDPIESYEDHSDFLRKPRYSSLFRLDYQDYKAWAKGLQNCGYATNKGYANMLIKTIEDYELYAFDRGGTPSWYKGHKPSTTYKRPKQGYKGPLRPTYLSYGLLYVLAREGDTFESVAYEFDLNGHKIAKYNDAPIDFPLRKGDVVYLQKKNSRATLPYYDHVVRVGESMHGIAQRYGIRMSNLYKMNDKDGEYAPQEGDVLRLR